jgi:hypothetical protein
MGVRGALSEILRQVRTPLIWILLRKEVPAPPSYPAAQGLFMNRDL